MPPRLAMTHSLSSVLIYIDYCCCLLGLGSQKSEIKIYLCASIFPGNYKDQLKLHNFKRKENGQEKWTIINKTLLNSDEPEGKGTFPTSVDRFYKLL